MHTQCVIEVMFSLNFNTLFICIFKTDDTFKKNQAKEIAFQRLQQESIESEIN